MSFKLNHLNYLLHYFNFLNFHNKFIVIKLNIKLLRKIIFKVKIKNNKKEVKYYHIDKKY